MADEMADHLLHVNLKEMADNRNGRCFQHVNSTSFHCLKSTTKPLRSIIVGRSEN